MPKESIDIDEDASAEAAALLGITGRPDTVDQLLRESTRRAHALARLADLGETGAFDELLDPLSRRP